MSGVYVRTVGAFTITVRNQNVNGQYYVANNGKGTIYTSKDLGYLVRKCR